MHPKGSDYLAAANLKGIDLVRAAMAHARSERDIDAAVAYARTHYGPQSRAFALVEKGAVSALGSDDITGEAAIARAEWFGPVREASVLGKLPNRRDVPFGVPTLSMSGGIRGYWVGQRQPIAVSKPAVTGSRLEPRKVGVIVPTSKEALRAGGPIVERLITLDTQRAAVGALDEAFLDSTNAGDDTTPASPLYGIAPLVSSGDPKTDIALLIESYEGDLATSVLISDPAVGVQLALSSPNFLDAGPRGGMAAGLPFLTSSFGPRDTSGGQLVLLDVAALAVALTDGTVTTSDVTTLLMSDAPETDSPPVRVSLYQNELVALKAVLYANWELQRAGAIRWMNGVGY